MNTTISLVLKNSATLMAMSFLLLIVSTANARLVVVDDQKDDKISKLECINGCTVDLKFSIVSTGFTPTGQPDPAIYTVTFYHEIDFANFGDVANDIVAQGSTTPGCDIVIVPDKPCIVTATFKVVDNDPNDDNQVDNKANQNGPDSTWDEGIYVVFTSSVAGPGLLHADHNIGVLDDVPEPTTWVLVTLGLGAVGAGLRRRRPAVA